MSELLLGLALGLLLGAGAAWGLAARRRQRTGRQLARLTRQLAGLTGAALERRLPVPAGELAALTNALNDLLARLQQAMESQRSFVTQASHKLRTPLTSITGQIEVTLIRPRSVAEHEQTWQSVLQDIARLNQLANDLLALVQLTADCPGARPQPVALDEVVYQAIVQLKARRPGYQVQFEFDPRLDELSGPLVVAGDPDLLAQACLQLLDNGCKFSPERRVHAWLGLSEGQAALEFRDHGAGITPADLPRIFEPFFRGDNARQVPGNGIGLALARRVAELHGGTLRVLSTPRRGTVARLQLPLAA
ncbi:sensor histidine kinase [Hymenobacter sp. B81]|uniref:sensor histidine kinase n=1 Tax=Hymenobacter sp. B81 TaxID=3344878 RepID=UPI0037DCDC3B